MPVAVKEGGADPANNSRLRDVIAKAKANNMPNDTIDRGTNAAPVMTVPSTMKMLHMRDMDGRYCDHCRNIDG